MAMAIAKRPRYGFHNYPGQPQLILLQTHFTHFNQSNSCETYRPVVQKVVSVGSSLVVMSSERWMAVPVVRSIAIARRTLGRALSLVRVPLWWRRTLLLLPPTGVGIGHWHGLAIVAMEVAKILVRILRRVLKLVVVIGISAKVWLELVVRWGCETLPRTRTWTWTWAWSGRVSTVVHVAPQNPQPIAS